MPKFSRRGLFPLFAAGGIVAVDGSQGASLDVSLPGIVARIAKGHDGWSILVPDFDSMQGWWLPGFAVPTKWMSLAEYLKLLDETYTMES